MKDDLYQFHDAKVIQSMRLHDRCKCESCHKEVKLLENELERRNEVEIRRELRKKNEPRS